MCEAKPFWQANQPIITYAASQQKLIAPKGRAMERGQGAPDADVPPPGQTEGRRISGNISIRAISILAALKCGCCGTSYIKVWR